MTKRTLIGLVIVVILLLLALVVGVLWRIQPKTPVVQTPTGSLCGGIAGIICPKGYTCSYPDNANYPDAAGHCVLK